MSKNRNHRVNAGVIDEAIPEGIKEEVVAAVEETVDVPEAVDTAPVIGVVTDCNKLRVRKEPNTNADVLCEIKDTAQVTINEKESTADFYKVCTEIGIEGYCMKKFIAVLVD